MKIQPVASPHAIQQPQTTPYAGDAAKAARERAISRLTDHPPVNPNNISAEELGAIRAPSNNTNTQLADTPAETTDITVETKPQQPKEDPLSKQYAMLARREKAIRLKAQQQEQQLRTREAELEARVQSEVDRKLAEKLQDYNKNYIPKERLKQNAMSVLTDELQLTQDDLAQQLLNYQPTDPRINATINKLESRITQLQEELQKNQKSYEDNRTDAYKAAVKQIENDVTHLVKTDPTFETIRATRSVKDVVELIERTYQEDGIVMTAEEAAAEVENYLVDEALKLSRLEKIQKRLNATASKSQSGAPAQQPAAKPQQQQQMKTLTNANSSTRKLSAKERAILAFKGELKS